MKEGMRTLRGFRFLQWAGVAALALGTSISGTANHASGQAALPVVTPVRVNAEPFAAMGACSGGFVAHDLEHVTNTSDGVIQMFEANGSGLGAGDLDGDGDLDLVFGNLDGPNTLLWNEGGLKFRKELFGEENSRAVSFVDVDGDGRLDVVVTLDSGRLNYWHNEGNKVLTRRILPGAGRPAYAMNWGDTDRDGDLDMVTATYDAGLLTDRGNEYLIGGGGGVTAYENRDGRLRGTALATEAQGLALLLPDVNEDGRLDIVVGNDFNVKDMMFENTDEGWVRSRPFVQTTHSTMSLDVGDVHNDGRMELFATDMKPYDPTDAEVAVAWAPLMADMMMEHDPYDPQVMENVLLVLDDSGFFYNVSEAAGVDGTGWSWSGRFGDLDQDGWLDLYVVNGFAEERLLAHLPNHELVEENQVLRNDGRGRFVERPDWGLASDRGGRSMVMADMDGDGDLDIVVNNVRTAAQLFENQLCGGKSVIVDLQQEGVQNRNAIGARVVLHTSQGDLTRIVTAGSAYLSSGPNEVHFGLGEDVVVGRAEVVWPDGAVSVLPEIVAGTRVHVTRERE